VIINLYRFRTINFSIPVEIGQCTESSVKYD
jgi:hypothetical protein